jgi:hypothetical protein
MHDPANELRRIPLPRTWVHSYLLDRVHQYAYNAWRPQTSRSLKFRRGGRALLPDPSGMGACPPPSRRNGDLATAKFREFCLCELPRIPIVSTSVTKR